MTRPSRSNLQSLQRNVGLLSVEFLALVSFFFMISYYEVRWIDWRDLWRFTGLVLNGVSATIITYIATSGFRTGQIVPRVKRMVRPLGEAELLLRNQDELIGEEDGIDRSSFTDFMNKELTEEGVSEAFSNLSWFLRDRFDVHGPIKKIWIDRSYNTPPGPSSRRVKAEINGDTENVCSIGELNNAIQSRGEQWTATVEGTLTILFLRVFVLGVLVQIATYLPRIAEIIGIMNGSR